MQLTVRPSQPPLTRTPALRVWSHVLAIFALGAALGLTFNAANPVGIRWREAKATPYGRTAAASSPKTSEGNSRPAESAPAATPAAPAAPAIAPAAVTAAGPAGSGSNDVATASSASYTPPSPTAWSEARVLLEAGRIVLVDCRSRPMYDAGHIPGAICLPEDSPSADLAAFRDRHGTNAHVVVYCSSTSCSLSFKLAYKLAKDYGFALTQYMTGGYFEYLREAGLLATNTPAVEPAVAAAPVRTNVTTAVGTNIAPLVTPAPGTVSQVNPQPVSWAKVEEWVLQRNAILVDTRPAEAFAKGHVPGAVSLPSGSPPEKITAFREERGTNRPVIVYGDMAGSMQAFLAGRQLMREAGFPSVRFVIEGYKEWQAQRQIPAPR